MVIKDNKLVAEGQSGPNSENIDANGYKLIAACLRADTLDAYKTSLCPLGYSQEDINAINAELAIYYENKILSIHNLDAEALNLILEYKRFSLYRDYMSTGKREKRDANGNIVYKVTIGNKIYTTDKDSKIIAKLIINSNEQYSKEIVYEEYPVQGEGNTFYRQVYLDHVKYQEPVITTLYEFMHTTSLPFFVTARLSNNYDIIYAPDDILDSLDLTVFKACYASASNYFLKVLYNDAYEIGNPMYNSFCKLCITIIAIKLFLNKRLEEIDNIDFFDEYSIKNLFLSYGLDYFFDMPLEYQRRTLKNINDLVKQKGTDRVFATILNIFGFDNIKVFKYVITKEYMRKPDGSVDLEQDPVLRFSSLLSGTVDLDKGIINGEKFSYEEITTSDPYWQMTDQEKKELIEAHWNYLNTKYIELVTLLDLPDVSLDFAYLINLVYTIEERFSHNLEKSNLAFANIQQLAFPDYRISNKKIQLSEAIVMMQCMILKQYGISDAIVVDPSNPPKVHAYNFDDLTDDDLEPVPHTDPNDPEELYYFGEDYDPNSSENKNDNPKLGIIYYIRKRITGLSDELGLDDDITDYVDDKLNSEWKFYKKEVLNKLKTNEMTKIDTSRPMTRKILINVFQQNKWSKDKSNVKVKKGRKDFEKEILATNNYEKYRELKTRYNCYYYDEFEYRIFINPETGKLFDTYTDWLNYRNPDLVKFIDDTYETAKQYADDYELIFNEKVFQICTDIVNYYQQLDFFIQGNLYLLEYIKKFIYKLINFFKAYTVQLRDMSIIYVFDDPFLNTILLFEEALFKVKFKQSQLIKLKDEAKFSENMVLDYDEIILKEKELVMTIIHRFKDYLDLNLKEKSKFHIEFSLPDLVELTDDEYWTFVRTSLMDVLEIASKDKVMLETILNIVEQLPDKEEVKIKEVKFYEAMLAAINEKQQTNVSFNITSDSLKYKERLVFETYETYENIYLNISISDCLYQVEQQFYILDLDKLNIFDYNIYRVLINNTIFQHELNDNYLTIKAPLMINTPVRIEFKKVTLKNSKGT